MLKYDCTLCIQGMFCSSVLSILYLIQSPLQYLSILVELYFLHFSPYIAVVHAQQQCYRTSYGPGRLYEGNKNVTISGRACQMWASQKPHKHSYKWLKSESNYCRNPGSTARPWCYTVDKNKRWEYCDVPLCSKSLYFIDLLI